MHQNLYEDNENCPGVRDRGIQLDKGFNQPRDLGVLIPEDRWYQTVGGDTVQANNDAHADFQCSNTCGTAHDWVCESRLDSNSR